MDRPAIGHGELNDRSHEQQAELGMDELPHRTVVDLQPTFGELGSQPPQSEIAPP